MNFLKRNAIPLILSLLIAGLLTLFNPSRLPVQTECKGVCELALEACLRHAGKSSFNP